VPRLELACSLTRPRAATVQRLLLLRSPAAGQLPTQHRSPGFLAPSTLVACAHRQSPAAFLPLPIATRVCRDLTGSIPGSHNKSSSQRPPSPSPLFLSIAFFNQYFRLQTHPTNKHPLANHTTNQLPSSPSHPSPNESITSPVRIAAPVPPNPHPPWHPYLGP
jgi:hypothetical protein